MNIGGVDVVIESETTNFVHISFGYNSISLNDYQELYDKGYRPISITRNKGNGVICEKANVGDSAFVSKRLEESVLPRYLV